MKFFPWLSILSSLVLGISPLWADQFARTAADGSQVTDYQYQIPRKLADGWETGDLKENGFDAQKVKEGMEQILDGTLPHIDSVVVVKGGKLVLDEYFYGFGPEKEHQLKSATKSVFSILMGLAVDQGLVKLDQKLYDFFPEYREKAGWQAQKDEVTLGTILTMRSGFECDDWQPPGFTCLRDMMKSKDWLSFCLSQQLTHKPGEHFAYSGTTLTPLTEILARQSGMTVPDFAQKYLYDPLGIKARKWYMGPHQVMEAGFGHCLKPRDMAKLGYLFLKKGDWNGRQVLSEKWVAESTSAKIPEADTHGGPGDYGYLWWSKLVDHGGSKVRLHFAAGDGGEFIAFAPDLDLVCAVTASNYGSSELCYMPLDFLEKYIVGADL